MISAFAKLEWVRLHVSFEREETGYAKTAISDLQGAWQVLRDQVVEESEIYRLLSLPEMRGGGHADVHVYFKCPPTKQIR